MMSCEKGTLSSYFWLNGMSSLIQKLPYHHSHFEGGTIFKESLFSCTHYNKL